VIFHFWAGDSNLRSPKINVMLSKLNFKNKQSTNYYTLCSIIAEPDASFRAIATTCLQIKANPVVI